MTDLLPIVFARGQNESVDPRLAPADVHAIAQNVRWRKDGRPAKRYGVAAVTTTGLSTGSFNTQPANAITSWNRNPVIAVGSRVSQLNSVTGWGLPSTADDGELSHFGPGKRDVIARDEASAIGMTHQSCGTASGLILYAWDNGTSTYYTVKGANGETVTTPQLLLANVTWPRVISAGIYIYILTKTAAGVLDLHVFDSTTLLVTGVASPGTLSAAGDHYDATGFGPGNFLITYQSAGNVTTKMFSATAVPVLVQTQNLGVGVAGIYLGIAATVSSNIFVVTNDATTGTIGFVVYNNTLTAALGGVAVEVDINNNWQPTAVIESNTIAQLVWGGFNAAANSMSYMRAARVSSAGVLGATVTFPGVAPASKPFLGPAYGVVTGIGGDADGPYIWVATHNADNGNTRWDTQRAYYLVKFRALVSTVLRRQMHAPNMIPDASCQKHLPDVLALGAGYGFVTALLNAVRFTAGNLAGLSGVDSISARSIFESVRVAARDFVTAGRALQFSGGSLFELNGSAEETGFTNPPVINGFTLAGGGALTPGATYIYQACYEWLDGQGRRHRSAPSDPVTVSNGANTQVTLTLTLMVADAHALNASGSAAGRGAVIHVYRTLAGQSTFHRVTPDSGAPKASIVGTATVTFVDGMSDTNAAPREIIYTDGGVLPNTLAPPSTFMCVCNGRVWLGGQLDGSVITASKILVDGEPTQFSEDASFSVFLPEACTGLASIDGTVVAFAYERVYFVTGDGPNDQGVGSFNPPTELPTDVGCIDWRSVVESSIGVFFQSKRGIYLLPRGFNTPQFIGAEVESTLAAYPKMISATLVSIPSNNSSTLGEVTARFVVGSDDVPTNTAVLVYDLRTGGWSIDEPGTGPLLSGTWSDAFITSRSIAGVLALHSESAASPTFADYQGFFIQTKLGTGDVRPFGVAGYGDFCSVVLLGEFRASSIVNVAVSVDGVLADTFTFTVTAADGADGSVYLDVTPKTRKGSSIRVTCYDSGNLTQFQFSEGFISQALFIESQAIGGPKRLAAARRA